MIWKIFRKKPSCLNRIVCRIQPGGTAKNHGNPQSGYPLCRPGFQPSTWYIDTKALTAAPNRSVTVAASPAVRWLRCEARHSLPSSADGENECSYTSSPPYVFMAWCLSENEDNFTFILFGLVRNLGAPGSVVGWGTMLQVARSRVRFPMRSLDFFKFT
jgi:hypothetical protein